MKILVVGAGIAGLTTAYWLHQSGFEVTVIEKAPAPNRHGFLLGIRGPSITVLKRMGLLDQVLATSIDTFPYRILSSKGTPINHGRYLSYKDDARGKLPINRADLERVLFEAICEEVDIRFSTTMELVDQDANGVEVHLSDGTSGRYDLLIGADGIHSSVRKLVFGDGFERAQDASYVAFMSRKAGQPIDSLVQFAKGMMSVVYDLSKEEFGGITVLKGSDFLAIPPAQRRAALIAQHESHGSPLADVIRQMSADAPIFADRMSQVVMPRWTDGRVVLLGDAAYCLTAASGFGATAALIGAYVLAEELAAHGLDGLARYETRLRPGIEKRQKSAAMTTGQIISENRLAIGVRDLLLKLIPDEGVYKVKKIDEFGITETSHLSA